MKKIPNIILSLGIFTMLLIGCQERKIATQFPIENYDQQVTTWFNPKSPDYDVLLLKKNKQKQYFADFYQHVFGNLSPWEATTINKLLNDDLHSVIKKIIADFDVSKADDQGYGENFRKYDQKWFKTIIDNIDLNQFKNAKFTNKNLAIAIDNTQARLLPTEEVYFYNSEKAGQGFPFDMMQTSALWSGTPVYVVAETKDHVWSFVITPDFYSWVKSKNIARVSPKFIDIWRKAARRKLAVVTKHHTTFLTKQDKLLLVANMGMVFPISKVNKNSYELLIPIANERRNAVFIKINANKKEVAQMPLAATPHNFSKLFAEMVDKPYGWGNLYFYNDCSAELKRIFAAFGIWLPRHSADQGNMENHVDISQFSKEKRLEYLMKEGKPLLSLVYIGGHVFLYVGTYLDTNGKKIVMTYQNIWGLRPPDNKSRSIIGKSVFLPLLLRYPEDPSLVSLLEKKFFKIVVF